MEIAAGVPMIDVKEVSGHDSISVKADSCGHLVDSGHGRICLAFAASLAAIPDAVESTITTVNG